jgi:hypothetical protein
MASMSSASCGMRQVGFQIGHRLRRVALLGMGQAPVAVFGPGLGQQHDQAVLHRHQARPVFLGAVDFLQVAQHAGDDVARRRGLQVQAQRHLELVHQAAAPLEGLQPLGQVLAAERLARKRVDHHLALGQVTLTMKCPGNATPARMQAQALGQLHPQHGQRDRECPGACAARR